MDTVVQHAGAWTVESVQLDLDDTGPRQWNRVLRPGERERWYTTSELEALLHAAGLDLADLVVGRPSRASPWALKLIADLSAEGHSRPAIAQRLNAEGVPTS